MRISDWSSDVCSSDLDALGDKIGPAALKLGGVRDIIAGTLADLTAVIVEQRRIRKPARDMRPGLGTAHRRSALVGRGKDGAEGCRARHRGESRWQIVAGAEELIVVDRSEEHTSELQSLMRISYAVIRLKK